MLDHEQQYRLCGLRTPAKLTSPLVLSLEDFMPARFTTYHYVSRTPQVEMPVKTDPVISTIKRPLYVAHQLELAEKMGAPRLIPSATDRVIRQWQSKNAAKYRPVKIENLLKRVKDPADTTFSDVSSMLVVNYSLLQKAYYYPQTIFKTYHTWYNQEKTIWETINRMAVAASGTHLYVVEVPKIIPSVTKLRLGEGELTTKIANLYQDDGSRFISELYKWLGPNRSTSILSVLDYTALSKIDLMFVDNGRFILINLGLLDSWRAAQPDEVSELRALSEAPMTPEMDPAYYARMKTLYEKLYSSKKRGKGINPQIFQKILVKLLQGVTSYRELAEDELNNVSQQTVVDATADFDQQITDLQSMDLDQDGEDDDDGEFGRRYKKTTSQTTGTMGDPSAQPISSSEPSVPEMTLDDVTDDNDSAPVIQSEIELLNKIEKEADQHGVSEELPDLDAPRAAPSLEEAHARHCDALAQTGRMSALEYKRHRKLAETYKNLKMPGSDETLAQFIDIKPEKLKFEPKPLASATRTMPDARLMDSSLEEWDREYIKKVLERDIVAMALSIQNGGVAVTNFDVERVKSITGNYTNYSMQIVPLEGRVSTIPFTIPEINEDGSFMVGGTKYRLRKQNGDLPIRKTGPNKVALSSYYGKMSVMRSEKKVHDYFEWLARAIMNIALDETNDAITEANVGSSFDRESTDSRWITGMSQKFTNLTSRGFKFVFAATDRPQYAVDRYKEQGMTILAYRPDETPGDESTYLALDQFDKLYQCVGGVVTLLGTPEAFLGIDQVGAPVDFSEAKIMGKFLPVGVILAYRYGFTNLIKMLGATHRIVEAGTRSQLDADEYAIRFSDGTYVFKRDERKASMVLAGFNEYRNTIKGFVSEEFNSRDVYFTVLDQAGMTARYLREVDNAFDFFVDPITRDILKEMGEPQVFDGLLIRASEMLLVDAHAKEIDDAFMRRKGYERVAGLVYSEIIKSVRAHKLRVNKTKAQITMNPVSVWMELGSDPAKIQVSDINPLHNLKEHEALTYSGTGGRNSRTMVAHTREFHENALGTVAESTSDSGDAGVNIYLSANPQFTSLRGISRRFDENRDGANALLSSSAMTAPYADCDDPKRTNFVSIQNSHTIACETYRPSMVRTGYEEVIAHRTDKLFATTAKQAGKVIALTEDGIRVKYEDGTTDSVQLGVTFSRVTNLRIPHKVVTDLKLGQKFSVGDCIAYNKDYFEPDIHNPGRVVMKFNQYAKVAFRDSNNELDDSSSISARMAEKMKTRVSFQRSIVLGFDDVVHKLAQVGDTVESTTILCYIEDELSARAGAFDPAKIDSLRLLSAQSPKADHRGTVDHIEVLYFGEKENMSDSLRVLADQSDEYIKRRCEALGEDVVTGFVDGNTRVDGEPLNINTAVINVFITEEVGMGIGDKGVVSTQLKTVVCEVFDDERKTENGDVIDIFFGARSAFNRIVTSVYRIGTTATILKTIAKRSVSSYFGNSSS